MTRNKSPDPLTVTGDRNLDLLPEKIEDLERSVNIGSGVEVRGAIYGKSVEIEGPSEIWRAVYSAGSVSLETARGDIRIFSSLAAAGDVRVVSGGSSGRVVVSGDVNGGTVALSGAIVHGGVFGDSVELENCIVLGIVSARETLRLRNSTVLTARAKDVVFESGCSLILPYAQAESFELSAPVELLFTQTGDRRVETLSRRDITVEGELQHLTGGKRLSNLGALAAELHQFAQLLLQVTHGALPGFQATEDSLDRTRLPAALRTVLDQTVPELEERRGSKQQSEIEQQSEVKQPREVNSS